MNSAFQGNDYFNIQRLVLHEKSHFLWAGLFDKKLKDDWADIGSWYLDPTVSSGWSTTKTTEFVSAYSHANNPDEDMAESISFYVMNPDLLMSRSIRKFEFIRDRIMNGTRYVAMIRQDLTFMVYNLFPDYNYPGKIKRVDVKVEGKSNEDKKITLEMILNEKSFVNIVLRGLIPSEPAVIPPAPPQEPTGKKIVEFTKAVSVLLRKIVLNDDKLKRSVLNATQLIQISSKHAPVLHNMCIIEASG